MDLSGLVDVGVGEVNKMSGEQKGGLTLEGLFTSRWMWVRLGTIYLIGRKIVVTSSDRNFFLGSGTTSKGPQEDISLRKSLCWYDESGASGGHLPLEVHGLVSSGSVPVVGTEK